MAGKAGAADRAFQLADEIADILTEIRDAVRADNTPETWSAILKIPVTTDTTIFAKKVPANQFQEVRGITIVGAPAGVVKVFLDDPALGGLVGKITLDAAGDGVFNPPIGIPVQASRYLTFTTTGMAGGTVAINILAKVAQTREPVELHAVSPGE